MGDGETEATSSPFLPAASKPKTKAPETNSNHQQSSKKYNSDENDNTDDSSSFSYHSALAIVPPDEAWDRIQRARHEAQDASYATWPPAIRLFHPFAVEEDNSGRVALEIAALIEEYSLASFTITLSEWSIVPHQEAMEVALSGTLKATTATKRDEYSRRRPGSEEDRKTQELIANEERIGKEKLLYRQAQKRKKLAQEQLELGRDAEDGESTGYDASNDDNSMESQSVPIWEEFNGPCVICLEPDPDSRDRIQALRYLLKHRLAGAKAYADLYSPTGSMLLSTTTTVSTKNARRPSSRQRMSGGFQSSSERSNDDPAAFRPVVPIASFPTVASAIGVARKLRKGWEPLTFNVTDLHSMSSQVGRRVGIGERNGDSHKRMTITEEPDLDISEEDLASQSTETFGISSQFGCDAMIYFMGEEVEMDPELNQELANMVFENGEEGGYNRGLNEQSSAKGRNSGDTVDKQPNMRKKEVSVSETFEKWLLEDDEEYDQGYVVVIGRTQFFTGEMRQYIGMPASSPYDSV